MQNLPGSFVRHIVLSNLLQYLLPVFWFFPLIYSILLGILGSAVAMVLFNKLIQVTSAVLASSVTYLIPIVAILWGILDGEAIQIQHFVGMGIILVGVYLVNKS